MIIICHKIW